MLTNNDTEYKIYLNKLQNLKNQKTYIGGKNSKMYMRFFLIYIILILIILLFINICFYKNRYLYPTRIKNNQILTTCYK